jgi:hypothetical protein
MDPDENLERRMGLPPGVLTSYVAGLVAAGWLLPPIVARITREEYGHAPAGKVARRW